MRMVAKDMIIFKEEVKDNYTSLNKYYSSIFSIFNRKDLKPILDDYEMFNLYLDNISDVYSELSYSETMMFDKIYKQHEMYKYFINMSQDKSIRKKLKTYK